MNNIVINNYQYSEFFTHYFSSQDEWLHKPEQPLLDYVKENIPDYINTVIIFGCAGGRDFIPFHDEYNCIGFDLASPSIVKWVCKTDNLTYYQCSIEDYLSKFDHNDVDLSSCLVYTQGTLMYVDYKTQTQFINHLTQHGCKNIVIHEYPPECPVYDQGHNGNNPNANFNPSPEVLNLFERKHFRLTIERQPTGFLYLNK
jgi:hypothetical protein